MSWWSSVVDFFSGDSFVDAAVGAAAGAVTAKLTGGNPWTGALIGGGLNYASGAGYFGDTAQGFTRGVGDGVAGLFTGGSGGPGATPQGSYSGWDSSGGGSAYQYGGPSTGVYGVMPTDGSTNFMGPPSDAASGFMGPPAGLAGGSFNDSVDTSGMYRPTSPGPDFKGLAGPTGSFQERLMAGLSNPNVLLKGGLALGSALTRPGMDNTDAAWATYQAQQGAADAENKAIRDRQNNTANTIEVSGGPDAMKTAMVRGANQVGSLQNRLGYTNSPDAVKASLVGKAKHQAGLNAQTAYASGDANARVAASQIRKYAPDASTAGLHYAAAQDTYNNTQHNADWKGWGDLTEEVLGYDDERIRRRQAQEGARP